jgi:hypothetical protein
MALGGCKIETAGKLVQKKTFWLATDCIYSVHERDIALYSVWCEIYHGNFMDISSVVPMLMKKYFR